MSRWNFGKEIRDREQSNPEWTDHFDRRIAAGEKPQVIGNMVRLRGADGRWHRRNGLSCCGCGFRDHDHKNYGRAAKVDPSKEPGR